MSNSKYPVAVVGGGPCGMMTALLLARGGVRTVVLERKTRLSEHPKAMGVSRRTAEIYRQLGLLPEIVRGSLSAEGRSLALWSKGLLDGEELGRTPITEAQSIHTPCEVLHCPQTWTEKVLFEALAREPLADFHFAAEVSAIRADEDSVRLALRSGEEFSANWVVAADGAASSVREMAGIGTYGPGDMGHFINTMFRAEYSDLLKERASFLYPVLTQELFEFFVAVDGGNLWLMHHFLQPGEKVEDYSEEKMESIVRYASGKPEVPVKVLSLRPWVMSPKVANSFRSGRILLTGDAAARLSPSGGLGLNTGLQAAHNLAWKLAMVCLGRASEKLLDTYDQERRENAVRTMLNTNENANEIMDIITKGLAGDWAGVRELIAQSRRAGSGLGQDLGVVYETGAVIPDGSPLEEVADPINDYKPQARPGHRAPHLWLKTPGGGRISILDSFGGRFLVVTKSGCWTAAAETGGMAAFCVGRDAEDEDGEFLRLYKLQPGGAVLIRPDGYIGARWSKDVTDPAAAIRDAMKRILGE